MNNRAIERNGVLNEQSIHQRQDEEKEAPADAGFGKEEAPV